MKSRGMLWTVALLMVASSFGAAEEWTRTYKVGATPTLTVSTSDAGIEVHAGAEGTITAVMRTENFTLLGSDPEIRMTESQAGDNVTITAKQRGGTHLCIFCVRSAHMTITAPAGTKLDIRTADGSLRVYDIKGPAELHTSDGSIEVYNFDGVLHARTSDGHITANGRFDDLRLETSDGSIKVDVERGSKVSTDWRLKTSDGSIRAALPDDLSADVALSTGDGSIHTDVSINNVHGPVSKRTLEGRLGNGGRLLEMRTSDGSIHLTRL